MKEKFEARVDLKSLIILSGLGTLLFVMSCSIAIRDGHGYIESIVIGVALVLFIVTLLRYRVIIEDGKFIKKTLFKRTEIPLSEIKKTSKKNYPSATIRGTIFSGLLPPVRLEIEREHGDDVIINLKLLRQKDIEVLLEILRTTKPTQHSL